MMRPQLSGPLQEDYTLLIFPGRCLDFFTGSFTGVQLNSVKRMYQRHTCNTDPYKRTFGNTILCWHINHNNRRTIFLLLASNIFMTFAWYGVSFALILGLFILLLKNESTISNLQLVICKLLQYFNCLSSFPIFPPAPAK